MYFKLSELHPVSPVVEPEAVKRGLRCGELDRRYFHGALVLLYGSPMIDCLTWAMFQPQWCLFDFRYFTLTTSNHPLSPSYRK